MVLTDREKEVLERLMQGAQFDEIAESLSIATITVRTHLKNARLRNNQRNNLTMALAYQKELLTQE